MWSERVVLGTSKLGVDGREQAYELLDEYVRLGGRSIDTASVYSDWIPGEQGRAETVIGEWLRLRGNRDGLTIVTKGAHPPLGRMEEARCDEASIRHDVELSLKRLGIERIDLWYLHRDDPQMPVAEIVGVLQELVGEGKIARFGASNWTLDRIEQALAVPGQRFASSQVLGNVFCRIMNPLGDKTCVVADAAMFHHAVANGLSLFFYTATAHGLFERRAKGIRPTSDYANPVVNKAVGKLEAIAREMGVDPAPMSLAAMLQMGPAIHTVIGPRDAGQLRLIWKGGETVLQPAILRRILATTGMSDFLA